MQAYSPQNIILFLQKSPMDVRWQAQYHSNRWLETEFLKWVLTFTVGQFGVLTIHSAFRVALQGTNINSLDFSFYPPHWGLLHSRPRLVFLSNACGRCTGLLAKTITGSGSNSRKHFRDQSAVHWMKPISFFRSGRSPECGYQVTAPCKNNLLRLFIHQIRQYLAHNRARTWIRTFLTVGELQPIIYNGVSMFGSEEGGFRKQPEYRFWGRSVDGPRPVCLRLSNRVVELADVAKDKQASVLVFGMSERYVAGMVIHIT